MKNKLLMKVLMTAMFILAVICLATGSEMLLIFTTALTALCIVLTYAMKGSDDSYSDGDRGC